MPRIEADQQNSSSRSEAARALAHAEAICREQGVRLTPIRRLALEVLHTARKPLGAYELAEALAPHGRRVAPITAYRALEFLIEQGLAHRLASHNAYIPSTGGPNAPKARAFLICEGCGCVDEVVSAELSEALADLLKAQGFRSLVKVIEVTGHCARCGSAR